MSPLEIRLHDASALQTSRLLASLKKAGIDLPAGTTVAVRQGAIYIVEKRNWRAAGPLIKKLRPTTYVCEADFIPDCPASAEGKLLKVSFSQPESGCGDYTLRTYTLIAEEETTPASPGEQIRALPRRPGAPSAARRLAGR